MPTTKNLVPPLFVLSLMGAGCHAHRCDDAPDATRHLCFALDIAENVKPENNEYASNEGHIQWKDDDGDGEYVSSARTAGFVSMNLDRADLMSNDLVHELQSQRPFAADYVKAIVDGKVFQAIGTVDAIAPGDIFAIRYLENEQWAADLNPEDSGVVAIVSEKPVPSLAGTPCDPLTADPVAPHAFDLRIVDSTYLPHGDGDTRGPLGSGAGIGTIRLFANAAGVIDGYSWSPQHAACRARKIVIGRLCSD